MPRPATRGGRIVKWIDFERHFARLETDVDSAGLIEYGHVLSVSERGGGTPVLHVTTETSASAAAIASALGQPPAPFLCSFHEGRHSNFGPVDGIDDLALFEARAVEIVERTLGEARLTLPYRPPIAEGRPVEEREIAGRPATLFDSIVSEGAHDYAYLLEVADGDRVVLRVVAQRPRRRPPGFDDFPNPWSVMGFHRGEHVRLADLDEAADRAAFLAAAVDYARRSLVG